MYAYELWAVFKNVNGNDGQLFRVFHNGMPEAFSFFWDKGVVTSESESRVEELAAEHGYEIDYRVVPVFG